MNLPFFLFSFPSLPLSLFPSPPPLPSSLLLLFSLSLSFFLNLLYFVYMCVLPTCICVCTPYLLDTHGYQKRAGIGSPGSITHICSSNYWVELVLSLFVSVQGWSLKMEVLFLKSSGSFLLNCLWQCVVLYKNRALEVYLHPRWNVYWRGICRSFPTSICHRE